MGRLCMWGEEVHGKSLYIPLNVAVILKHALNLFKKIHFVISSWRKSDTKGRERGSKKGRGWDGKWYQKGRKQNPAAVQRQRHNCYNPKSRVRKVVNEDTFKIKYLKIATHSHTMEKHLWSSFYFILFIFLSFVFLGPHPQHMEIPRLGVESEL